MCGLSPSLTRAFIGIIHSERCRFLLIITDNFSKARVETRKLAINNEKNEERPFFYFNFIMFHFNSYFDSGESELLGDGKSHLLDIKILLQ